MTAPQDEKITFSKFGKAFQEKLAYCVLTDKTFSNQMTEVLNIDHLEMKYLQAFIELIFDYKKQYEVHPTFTIIVSIVRTEMEDYSEVVRSQVKDYLSRIHTGAVNGDDSDYVREKALDFCKKQKLKEAILKSVGLLQTSSFEKIQSVINEAMKLGTSTDCGHDFIQDFEDRYTVKARNPSSTGWTEIDSIIRGGLGKRELGVIVAPTGAGKSMALVHLGTQALKQGKTVIHYTLELADTTVGNRYDSCITGVPLKELFNCKEQILQDIQKLEGTLIIKEYPTKSATINTLENHLDRIRQRGYEPDMVIVDYGDLLRPQNTTYRQELRHNLGDIYEEMRGLAQKYDIPVWTASQTNRSGLNAEVITMESISEAFNKCFVADLICSISRTVEDKSEDKGRMFVAKNRNGPDGIVYPMHIDTSRVRLEVRPPDEESGIDSVVVKTKQEQQEWLQKKYKKLKLKT
jgi:replicative DNA helicase